MPKLPPQISPQMKQKINHWISVLDGFPKQFLQQIVSQGLPSGGSCDAVELMAYAEDAENLGVSDAAMFFRELAKRCWDAEDVFGKKAGMKSMSEGDMGMDEQNFSRQELEEAIMNALQKEGILDRIMSRVSGNQSALKALGGNIASVFGAITKGQVGQIKDPRLVKAAAMAAKRMERHRTSLIGVLSELSKDMQFLFGEKVKDAPPEVKQQLDALDETTAQFMLKLQDVIKATMSVAQQPSANFQVNKADNSTPTPAKAKPQPKPSQQPAYAGGPTQFENKKVK